MAVVVHLSRTEETYVQQFPEVPVEISDEIQVSDSTIESTEPDANPEIVQTEVDMVSTENSSEIIGV